MKLTKITARNFKGLSFTLDLASINFLVGSNFAGKTARADAIRLLLIGYLPELGRTNAATFRLASGRDMEVSGEFDDGRTISRQWVLKGDSIKYSADAPGFDEADQVLAVMLNAEVYFALGATDRVRYVFENIGALTDDARYIAEVKEKIAPLWAASPATISKFEETFPNPAGEEAAQEWVAKLIANVTKAAKEAKDFATGMEKTAQGLAYLRTQDNPTASLDMIESERAQVIAEIAKITEEKARYQAAAEQSRKTVTRRSELALAVKAKPNFLNRRVNLQNTLDAKESNLVSLPAATNEEVEALRAEERESAVALRDYERDLRDVDAAIARNNKDHDEIHKQTFCPYCKATGESWKIVKLAEVDAALNGLGAKRDQLVEHIARLREANIDLLRRFNEKRDALAHRNALTIEIASLNRDLEGIAKDIAVIEGKEEDLANLPAADATAIAAVNTAQAALNAANDRLSGIDRSKTAALARTNDLKRLAEAEKARDDARVEEKVAKESIEVLKAIQRKMVEDAFGPLLKAANSFFPSVIKSPIAYNADTGEIGTWRNGLWVSHLTMSGTEKALTYAAIQAALAAKSPIRIMLLDELGRLDEINLAIVAADLSRAVRDGLLDQVIGIDAIAQKSDRLAVYDAQAIFATGRDIGDCKVVAIV